MNSDPNIRMHPNDPNSYHSRLYSCHSYRVYAFTLVELLVVMTIIGILATLIAGGFLSAQIRGRDGQRKSNLKQIANALELYYNDYGKYPVSSNGLIFGCPDGTTSCQWGGGPFTDNKTTYMKTLPIDPVSSQSYYYRVVDPPTNRKYQLFARLENTQDSSIITTSISCGTAGNCNFAVTSANTTPTE